MGDLKGREAAFNGSSRDQWDGFAGHRRKVSALLGAGANRGLTRICVLGAGNGNDLDLQALLAVHREVHLVDLDPEALALGVARQGVVGHPALRLHGGLDVTGMIDAIATWSPATLIGPADLAALADWPASRVGLALPGPFDLVASTCLLSPLIGAAYQALGGRHPRWEAVVRAIRAGHLRLLAHLARPSGVAVLITDVVSSETVPALSTMPESALGGLLPRLAIEGNHIQGVHPSALLAALRGDLTLVERISSLKTHQPWRWHLHARDYLVWALTLQLGPDGSRSARSRGERPSGIHRAGPADFQAT